MPVKLNTDDVPQADDLEKVLRSLSLRSVSPDGAARALNVVRRQVDYYRHAARILGYLDEENSLTRAGEEVLSLPDREKLAHVRSQFERSACGTAWIRWSRASNLEGVRAETAEAFLIEVSPLKPVTARRRAKTLESWYAAFRVT